MNAKRWPQIDGLYTIGTILVVMGHSHSSDWNTFNGTFLATLINFIYYFHMPLFFFIAGFLFSNSKSLHDEGYLKWICRKALKILTPYFLLSVIAAVPKFYLDNGMVDWRIIYDFLRIIFVPRKGIWGHFWFLPVLLALYVIAGAIYGLYSKEKYVLPAICISTVVFYYLPVETQLFGISDLKNYAIFFAFGMLVYRLLKQGEFVVPLWIRMLVSVSGVTLTLWAAVNNYADKTLSLILAVIMIYVCWQGAEIIGESKFCRWISRHNFTIYIYSWPVQAIVMTAAERLRLSCGGGTSTAMFAAGMTVPVIMAVIYDNFKVINNRFLGLALGVK